MSNLSPIEQLTKACRENDMAGVEEALSRGADPNGRVYGDKAPIVIAYENRFMDVVDTLINAGANVNTKDREGQSLLLLAAKAEDTKNAKYFINLGADINAATPQGFTPLHFAAKNGDVDLVNALLGRNDCIVDPINNEQKTPYHLAMMGNHNEVANELVGRGANTNPAPSGRLVYDTDGNPTWVPGSSPPPAMLPFPISPRMGQQPSSSGGLRSRSRGRNRSRSRGRTRSRSRGRTRSRSRGRTKIINKY